MHESEIILNLKAADPSISDDALEQHMFAMLDAVEEHVESALGPVVAVDFDHRAIELAFSLCHETQSDAQQVITDALRAIESKTPIAIVESTSRIGRPPRDEQSATYALA